MTSGRGLNGEELIRVLDYYKKLNKDTFINLCASHGIIDKKALEALRESGVRRYHHNVETSKNYYGDICSTHTYEERIKTIECAKEVGLEICSGGIIGMGETREDRVDMAIELRELGVVSIPINVLMPIKGTLLENVDSLTEEEIFYRDPNIRRVESSKVRYQLICNTKLHRWCLECLTRTQRRRMKQER